MATLGSPNDNGTSTNDLVTSSTQVMIIPPLNKPSRSDDDTPSGEGSGGCANEVKLDFHVEWINLFLFLQY